jgi:hypothetical protein
MTVETSPASLPPRGAGVRAGLKPSFGCRWAAVGFVGVTLSITGANAQDRPKKGGLKLGPFQVSAVAPFTAGVDSNVYNTPLGVDDQSFTITPTIEVLLPLGRRVRIRNTGGIAPYYFRTEKSQRHTDLFGRTRTEVDVGPLTLFGGIEGARYRQRFSLEIDERIRRDVSGHVFGATFRIRRQLTLTASQHNVKSTFDPEASFAGQQVSVALDRNTQKRTVQLAVPLTRKTSLVPWVDLIEDEFLSLASGAPPLVKSARYGAAFEFSDLAFFNGRAAAGVRHYSGGGGVPSYDGPFLGVGLEMPFILRTRLQLSAARDVNYSATPSAAGAAIRQTYVAGRYGSTLIFELPWKLQGRIIGGFDETRYLSFAGSDQSVLPPREHGTTFGGVLLRHLGDHLSLGVIARHVERTSPVASRTYSDDLYGVTGDFRF